MQSIDQEQVSDKFRRRVAIGVVRVVSGGGEGGDDGGRGRDGGGEDEPPSGSRPLPPPLSRFALREDGVMLLSLEDAQDRDLAGRTVISFLVLTEEEVSRARSDVDQALSGAAAGVIGRLPKIGGR